MDKKVLFTLSLGSSVAMVAGQKTAANAAIIEAAGLNNAMQGFTCYPPLTHEDMIARQPDWVLLTATGVNTRGGEAHRWALPSLPQTPAGQHPQRRVVDGMALLGFAIDTPQAILALRNRAEPLP